MVARKLNRMIAENPTLMRIRTTHRPLLLIMDRNSDLITPIQHNSTYQALIDDVLKHSANRVEFALEQEGKRPVVKKYDLDPDVDSFYANHKFNPFPEAIESNGDELQKVTSREAEIRSKTSGSEAPQLDTQASELSKTISSLPALLEHKKNLEIHTSILQAVMTQVAERDIPVFYELETALATGTYKNDLMGAKKLVAEILQDSSKGAIWDKIRLLSIYCLAVDASLSDITDLGNQMKQSIIEKEAFTDKNIKLFETGMKAITYLKKLRSINSHTFSIQEETSVVSPSSGSATTLSSFMANASIGVTGLLAKATEKVGTFLGKVHKHHITMVVENLCEYREEDESFCYFDPKIKGEVEVAQMKKDMMIRGEVKDVIAFMIGGGCYAEYQNLVSLMTGRRVSYGGTELFNSEAFLGQLGELG